MKIQRTPIILLAIAAVLGGAVYLIELNRAIAPPASQSRNQKLFPFEEADVQTLKIQTPLRTLQFTKVPAASPSPSPPASPSPVPQLWQMTAPTKTAASDGAIAFLLNLLGSGSYEKSFTVPTAQLKDFGFTVPQATVEVTLANQTTHRLVLGEPDFNRSFLYAQIDPDSQAKEQTIYLVSLDFENAVNRPLPEWKYTASPSPTPSPLPSPPAP